MRRDIEHPVVSGHEHALSWPEPGQERGHPGVDPLQHVGPRARLDAVGVSGAVELGDVEVDQHPVRRVEHIPGDGDAIGDRAAATVFGAAQDGAGEAGVAVSLAAHDDSGYAGIRCPLEHRRHPLPCRRVDALVPPVQLVHHPLVRGVEHRVADEPVLARRGAGHERGESRCGGGREPGIDGARARQAGRERARVTGAGAQRLDTEAVDEHHHDLARGGQIEGIALAEQRPESGRHHVGEAEPVRFPGR